MCPDAKQSGTRSVSATIMDIVIQPTTPADFEATEAITRDAFWDVYKPGCDEHFVLHNLRSNPAYIPELDLVATDGGQVIGNIVYSRAKVVDENNQAHEVLTMGPISVMPQFQQKGIGSQLIKYSIERAKELGYKAVIIFGNPAYYHRFGFVSAQTYNIQTSQGEYMDACMALELNKGGLVGIAGRFHEDDVFHCDKNELEAFEKKFPFREKHVTDTQLA